MPVGERDPHTGHAMTGHEWNGIKELNTPVPKPVWFFLIATVLFSVGYWILMPAWPLGATYTKGLLGIDQRTRVADDLETAAMNRATWTEKIEAMDLADIQADAGLTRAIRETGPALFGDNCSVCHGSDARGGKGYPDLKDAAWLWGGDPVTVAETLRVGINSSHDETRVAVMTAFGREQILDRQAILDVVSYVRSLSGGEPTGGERSDSIAAGAEVFAANCVDCHGEDGTGNAELGAPDLTDDYWIYGGDRQSVYTSVYRGRQGHMPHWEGRLSALERKILTLFVLDSGAAGE